MVFGLAVATVVGSAGLPRLVAVDHCPSQRAVLFEAVRQLGGEKIISKRAGNPYRGGTNQAEDQGQRDRRFCYHRLCPARGGRGPLSSRTVCWCLPGW
jgi:hypothetical protein